MSVIREMVADAFVDPVARSSVLKPYVMSHGTLECRDLQASRRFYEEFLGLDVVQHGPRSMAVRCGLKFHVICVGVGDDQVRPLSYLTHWGLDVPSHDEVTQAHQLALANQEKYAIRKVTDPVEQHGVYSFYIEDLDYNWWEIQFYEAGYQHTDIFEFGDVFTTSLPQAA
jgi:catechol 2,3-dioxygenase-like lactoylglutathione lyase family enzyme